MGELRWILLVLGILGVGAIWWGSARRSRQAPGNAELRESTVAPDPTPSEKRPAESREWGISPLEPLSIRTADFDKVPALDHPMLTHADPLDLGPDLRRATGVSRFSATAMRTRSTPLPEIPPAVEETPLEEIRLEEASIEESAPLESPELPDALPDPLAEPPPSDRMSAAAPETSNTSEQQKIVTVRVCAVGEALWSGADLMNTLEVHGLAYGRYQVYHRKHNDGRSIFYVASLVEPGTFDMASMAEDEFRGVSLFAVLPGPLEPLQTVDVLLATARDLAKELSGTLQDAKGFPFSPQRAAALRDDVTRFQAMLP